MTEHGIHQLPVVDGERPVGIVALRDVARPVLTGRLSAIGLGF
jgi:CBS domain-containing protein